MKYLVLSVACLIWPLVAAADEPAAISKADQEYWSQGSPRLFGSIRIDVGYIYLRPIMSVGYGRPFHSFVGLDVLPAITNTGFAAYGGIRAAYFPWIELRSGVRYEIDFDRSFLTPKTKYDRFDLDDRTLPGGAHHATIENELNLQVRTFFGVLTLQSSAYYVFDTPRGVNVFEDELRVITTPPWLFREKFGYRIRIKFVQIGPIAEVLYNPQRSNDIAVRAGISIAAILSPHLEVLADLVPVVYGRDNLGFAGGDFGTLGFRYRLATGSGGTDTWDSFLRQ